MKKLFISLALVGLFSLNYSCKDDPCEDVICYNGDCINGSCDCDDGYTGVECNNQITPDKIKVMSIKLTNYPATTSSGGGWDDGGELYGTSYPDIAVYLFQDDNPDPILLGNTGYLLDHSGTAIYDLSDYPYIIDDPNALHGIAIVDMDGLDGEVMDFIEFVPYFNTNGFPSTIYIYSANSDAELTFSYVW